MSHRWNCPTEREAEREGERAQEWGRARSSNPYENYYWSRDRACPEASEAWREGYRRAEIREEEQREEEAARQRAARDRAERENEDCAWMDRQAEADYYAMQQEQYADGKTR